MGKVLFAVDEEYSGMVVSASRILRDVSNEGAAFHFFNALGNNAGQSATSLDEFLQKIRDINVKSLEFHLNREDFEKWMAQTLGDAELAEEIKHLRDIKAMGYDARDRLYFMVSRRLKDLKTTSLDKE